MASASPAAAEVICKLVDLEINDESLGDFLATPEDMAIFIVLLGKTLPVMAELILDVHRAVHQDRAH